MEEKLVDFIKEMTDYLLISHLKKLLEVLARALTEDEAKKQNISNNECLKLFFDAKKTEGCSECTLDYYEKPQDT